MKYCVIVPDGAADYPLARLDGKTPLEAARTPSMDRAAREGLLGLTNHVPRRMTPGSSVAMMSVAGYDPARCFTGRGPLEAADLGIEMGPRDWAVRCNLITAAADTLVDFTAGHISTEEARVLIEALDAELGSAQLKFHVGTSYRRVLLYGGPGALAAETVPPHDVVGQPLRDNYPRGENSRLLVDLMERSRAILDSHDVNHVRRDLGKNPANMIWLWGQGVRPDLAGFEGRFGVRGAVISAVNLVRGIGRLVGWEVITVPGATAYVDTDYAAKGRYAVDALTRCDLVLVHIEAPDEASHERDLRGKIRALECIDRDIVGPVMAHGDMEGGLRVLTMPDHVTSVEDGKHKRGRVPFAMWGRGIEAASGYRYTEADAEAADVEIEHGWELMSHLVGKSGA
ncbi:MAG: cofactor-independent phosphoglycerate mutase [Candidatus Brocadiae bacterium]|nr:cofactor-independent phosphoglycerate mutase [Candidatus Brocadiia bacterium]